MDKLTIVGDIHCRLENLDKVRELFKIVEELGNPVILLGDLLDTKDIVRARCLNLYYELISQSKLDFIALVGNHDLVNLESTEHALTPLKALQNLKVVDEPFVTEKILFLPYSKHKDNLIKHLAQARVDAIEYVFGHLDVKSFDYGNGFISEEGLQLEDLAGFKRVISGHYHKYQQKENLTYLGTPFSHSFGESNQIKYLAVLDTVGATLELIETPFPKHITFEFNCNEPLKGDLLAVNHKDYNRFILMGTPENIKKVPRQAGIKYIEKPSLAEAKRLNIDETQSHEQQFQKWSKQVKKYDKLTVDLGLEILKDVR